MINANIIRKEIFDSGFYNEWVIRHNQYRCAGLRVQILHVFLSTFKNSSLNDLKSIMETDEFMIELEMQQSHDKLKRK